MQIYIQKGTKYLTKQSRKLRETEGNHLRIAKKIVNHIPSFGVKGKVFGREKSLYSIYLKMKEKRVSFAEVFDIHGFRIIVKTLTECYLCLERCTNYLNLYLEDLRITSHYQNRMDTNHYTLLLWDLWNTVGVTNKNRENAQFVRSRYCLSLALQEKRKRYISAAV